MVDLVAFVLEFVNGLDVIDEIARLFEILDCIDEKLGLLQGKLGQLLVGFEVVELVLFSHAQISFSASSCDRLREGERPLIRPRRSLIVPWRVNTSSV